MKSKHSRIRFEITPNLINYKCSFLARSKNDISYHLNKRIKELQQALDSVGIEQLQINGKIYYKQEDVLNKIYPNVVCTEYFSLN